ncbi:COPI associated protein-domain-containing protein [Hyaloraphidium curvatum]|nr:COPI associated protein-domain-containing protein [Hyaloraphidium curvatum]
MADVNVPAVAWKAVNVACAAFVLVSAIFWMISGGFRGVVLGIFEILLSGLLIFLEFKAFEPVSKWAPFLFIPFGRGLVMFLMGILVLDSAWWLYILTLVLNTLVGIYYMVAQFVPQLPQPVLSAGMSGLVGGGDANEGKLPYGDIEQQGGFAGYGAPGGSVGQE